MNMFDDIRLIIYDFDGTIGDSAAVIVRALKLTLEAMGMQQQSDEALLSVIGMPLAQCFYQFESMSEEKAERCAATYRALFPSVNTPGAVTLFPGVYDTMRTLHEKGIIQTIASSRSHVSLAEYVVNLKLSAYVAYMLGCDDVARPKPDACPVVKTMETLNILPQHTLVVGDAPVDILMGRAAGAKTCAVTYGNATRESLVAAKPDVMIDDFAMIPELLN